MFEFPLDVTHAGCSLKVILDWAWDRVVDIKDHLDQLCKNKRISLATNCDELVKGRNCFKTKGNILL